MKKILLTAAACFAISAVSFGQFAENFESTTGTALPTGWTQTVAVGTPNDSVGWNSGDNTTLNSTDFNPNAHTRYLAVNDDKHGGANNGNSFLMTPSFSLGSGSWWLSFDCSYLHGTYPATGGFTEAATVEVSTNGGSTWTVVSTLAGNATYWWEPRYIDLSAYAGSASVMLGFRYKDNTGWLYGWAIDNVKVFAPPANDISMVGIAPVTGAPASYGLGGSNITMTGGVFNNGATAISSYTVNYIFNGGSTVSNVVSGTIAPFTSGTFTATTPVTLPSAIGPYPIKMWVSLTGDVNATNDSAAMDTLNTVSFLPTKRLVFEEGTGTWCGWCVRGIVYMDSLKELYGSNVSLVAVHNADPMKNDNASAGAYDTWMGTKISGYPSVVMDRSSVIDPGNLLAAYTANSGNFGFADLTAAPTLTGANLSVAVTVKPALNLNGDYRVVLALTEDQVHGTVTGWEQHNYYSYTSQNQALTGQGVNYQDSLNPIAATSMYYNHVARSINPSVTGTSGVLPASMTYGTTYPATLTATLAANWSRLNMNAVVMLLDNATGRVLNSANFPVPVPVGVATVAAGLENVNIFPNPATNEAFIQFNLKNDTKLSIEVYDAVGRVVLSVPSSEIAAGIDQISLPLANLTTGIYNVKIQTTEGVTTTKLNVVK